MNWIPCGERMPEHEALVLVYAPAHREHPVSAAYYIAGVRRCWSPLGGDEQPQYALRDGPDDGDPRVTHWMPLPAPPPLRIAIDEGDPSQLFKFGPMRYTTLEELSGRGAKKQGCQHNPREPDCTVDDRTLDAWSGVCRVCLRRAANGAAPVAAAAPGGHGVAG